MLTAVCQTHGFVLLAEIHLEGIKECQRFAKLEQFKNTMPFYKDRSSQYDVLIATRGKIPFEANAMNNLSVTHRQDWTQFFSTAGVEITTIQLGIRDIKPLLSFGC